MVIPDLHACAGYALELLAQSAYHKRQPAGRYFRTEILPPLLAGQARFYLTGEGIPGAMATWAWLSEEVEREVHETGRALEHEEWRCGSRLFFNDWVAPCGHSREAQRDMARSVFPGEAATSIRRNPDGSVRRINRWTGIDLRRAAAGGAP